MRITPVILSGGSGTRLWPLSRRSRPKQFLALTGPDSLFQQTIARTSGITGVTAPVVIGNRDHSDTIVAQFEEVGVEPAAILVEPHGRNTAPAVALAAHAIDRTDLMLVMPSDSLILDEGAFRDAVAAAVAPALDGRLVTFGVEPTRPETGYGYIEVGESRGGWSEVERFVEKPDAATAETYVSGGRHLWNAGMFLFTAERLLEELGAHAPEIIEAVDRSWRDREVNGAVVEPGSAFSESPSISIDNAVLEVSDRVAVVPMNAGWSDLGSWQALFEAGSDGESNVTIGNALVRDVSGSYIRAGDRLVAVVGLDDVVVVDTPDAILIAAKGRTQDVKSLLDEVDPDLL